MLWGFFESEVSPPNPPPVSHRLFKGCPACIAVFAFRAGSHSSNGLPSALLHKRRNVLCFISIPSRIQASEGCPVLCRALKEARLTLQEPLHLQLQGVEGCGEHRGVASAGPRRAGNGDERALAAGNQPHAPAGGAGPPPPKVSPKETLNVRFVSSSACRSPPLLLGFVL
jgi:hypothetical protein